MEKIFSSSFSKKSFEKKDIARDSGYYSEFRHFDKYANQIDSIVDEIKKLEIKSRGKIFNFVDVGSHDGELTSRLLKIISEKNIRTKTYAFEPDKVSYQKLNQRFAGVGEVEADNLDFEGWISKYSDSLKDKVDLLLNSHTFYHFPKEKWESVIKQVSKLLSDTGKHVIIIDSQQTSINKIKDNVDKALGRQKKIEGYGKFLFGSHLVEQFFKSQDIDYEHKFIDKPIIIPDDDNSLQNFTRILGFIFRHKPEDISKLAKEQIMEFMAQYKKEGKYIFPRTQEMFILKK